MTSAPVLELGNLSKRFGALQVTGNVSLNVGPGEIHAVIGPNGAGKSTLIAQICGDIRSDSGDIRLDGARIEALPPHRRARLGLSRAYQVPSLFHSLSVEENVIMPLLARHRPGLSQLRRASADHALRELARESLRRVGLAGRAGDAMHLLAHGEKRQLEIAMALASSPRLLLLDEPLAGLGGPDSRDMIALLASLKGAYAVLLVEHDMDAVFALADRISVLVAGRIVASGTAEEVRRDPAVRAAYLGDA